MRAWRYSDLNDEHIYLVVPWRDGSGNIPPPYIRFTYSFPGVRRERQFVFNGVVDDETVVIVHDATFNEDVQ